MKESDFFRHLRTAFVPAVFVGLGMLANASPVLAEGPVTPVTLPSGQLQDFSLPFLGENNRATARLCTTNSPDLADLSGEIRTPEQQILANAGNPGEPIGRLTQSRKDKENDVFCASWDGGNTLSGGDWTLRVKNRGSRTASFTLELGGYEFFPAQLPAAPNSLAPQKRQWWDCPPIIPCIPEGRICPPRILRPCRIIIDDPVGF